MIRDNFTFEMELLKNPWTRDKTILQKWQATLQNFGLPHGYFQMTEMAISDF